jgi:hypothetical protein
MEHYYIEQQGMGLKLQHFMKNVMAKTTQLQLLKTDGNYVFGGYTAAKWTSGDRNNIDRKYTADTKAFIFSVRRKGISCNHKFMVNDANRAIYGSPYYGPTFGSGYDFFIKDKSNINIGSYTYLGHGYHYPSENVDRKSSLAGSFEGWLTTEIEVYKINK